MNNNPNGKPKPSIDSLDAPRLIEHAFPLKQASLTSVHEKNVRHGHISTLHIWPARRPLAACRAALIATLLPDPGTPEKRKELCERIGGTVVEKSERKAMPNGKSVERVKEEVVGGILSWIGTEPKSGSKKKKAQHRVVVEHRENELQWFRDEIRKAYDGRVPRVLDPFAGGGAIPLEAMRLGCEATAVDINPVAWFILKCTLEYPQKLAGKTHPLSGFILDDEAFMADFYKAHPDLVGRTKKTKKQLADEKNMLPGFVKPDSGRTPKADLAWHVRAWGRRVLNEARKGLAPFYPTYADFEPINLKNPKSYERQKMRLVPTRDDGTVDIEALNTEFSEEYRANKRNPRWVAKSTIAYLWARTVTCKNCRATVPLLKIRWLCKKANKRVLLTMEPNAERTGVIFGIDADVPVQGGNAAQHREHDKRIGAGTMSRAGAQCPCCAAIMTMEDIRVEGKAQRLGSVATAVVTESQTSKAYRLPTPHEIDCAIRAEAELERVFADIPFGLPTEPTPNEHALGMRIPKYGFSRWCDLFTSRQLLALGTLVKQVRRFAAADDSGLPREWQEAVAAYLVAAFDRCANYMSTICIWEPKAGEVKQTFLRFALPITWDFAEGNPLSEADRYFNGGVSCVFRVLQATLPSTSGMPEASIHRRSATDSSSKNYDVILTDPPYYDAIPYSDLMDFFYIWLKRLLSGLNYGPNSELSTVLSPKWDAEANDGELIDDASRHDGDSAKSKAAYEDGMARAFSACAESLQPDGRLVVVFAHKHPDAWETLASAIMRAGFIVDGSWPIVTEMRGGVRNYGRASLASSVWLVCKKRPTSARVGWDNRVLEEMRANIADRLRDFWDAGIRGPDFVWAATGPALEAYSKHPVVKKANDPGQIMTVGEFLIHVRRMVVDFVVGQVLSGEQDGDMATADRMDSPTAYYLLHRHDFGLDEAPAGACILYATACGISDRDLEATWDLISTKGSSPAVEEEDESSSNDANVETDSGGPSSGGQMQLKTWLQRKGRNMGYDAPSGRPVPLIDRVHRLMHLWRAGDVHKVDDYLDDNGLRRHELFKHLVQSLIELSDRASEERTLLESLSNHIGARGVVHGGKQDRLPKDKS